MKSLSSLPWSYLRIYLYLEDSDIIDKFLTDANAQGYRLSDELYLSKSSSYYRIFPNHTYRPVLGWAGNEFVKHLPMNKVQNDCLLIDYKHFLSLDEYELI